MSATAKLAIKALSDKASELIEERASLRRRLLEDAARDQQIDRDIAGCMAGAKALGGEIVLSEFVPSGPPQHNALANFMTGRNQIAMSFKILKDVFGVEDGETIDSDELDEEHPKEMPRVADIILERLKVASAEGSKAAEIRRYIFKTYKADIHEKTVGMTLYRLQKEGVVRREGHVWFLASSEARTPDGDTSGIEDLLQ